MNPSPNAESVPTCREVLASLDWLLRVHDSDPSQKHLSVVVRHIAAQDQRIDDLEVGVAPLNGSESYPDDKCPEHGPRCSGIGCCCRDKHRPTAPAAPLVARVEAYLHEPCGVVVAADWYRHTQTCEGCQTDEGWTPLTRPTTPVRGNG